MLGFQSLELHIIVETMKPQPESLTGLTIHRRRRRKPDG